MSNSADSILDALPPPPAALSSRPVLPSLPAFEILCELGRGGMGRVFKARQLKLNRIVAVKMLHAAEFAEPKERERFMREAQALATLQHPHIVQIFEVGEDRDRPFLVMECLDGGSLEKHLRGQPLEPATAAGVLETLAGAVDYVHQRGLLHRDLKLANVLINSEPDRPLQADKVKLTDFGLAKPWAGQRTGSLPSNAIVGTPNYMAPEQAMGQPVTPATDVYSLGAILYELMTGRPPFRGPTLMDTLAQVIGTEPASPRRLVPSLPLDLETICQKCLRKNPSQRYRSAGELAEDLKRFRNGRPILARPISSIERLSKWARRRPAIATLIAVLVISILMGICLVTWKWQESVSANTKAQRNHQNEIRALGQLAEERIQGELLRREAMDNRIRGYASLIVQADRAWQLGSIERCRRLLDLCPEELRNWEWHFLRRRLHGNQTIHASDHKVRQVAFRSDGKLVASAGGRLEDVEQDGAIKLWDPVTRKLLFELNGKHKGPVTWLAFHPNNRWLISLSLRLDWRRLYKGDVTALNDAQGECVLWDLDQKKSLLTVPDLFDVGALSEDGTLFAAAGSDRQTHIFRLDSTGPWKVVAKLPPYSGVFRQLAFSPDGKLLARAGTVVQGVERGALKFTSELKLWRCNDGSEAFAFPIPHVEVAALAFSPNGRDFAWSNGTQNTVTLWDLQANRALQVLTGHESSIQSIAFDKAGKLLATGGQDRFVKIWDPATGKELRTLRGHDDSVECVAFATGKAEPSRPLASAGADGTIQFWNPDLGQEPLTLAGHRLLVTQATFSPNGQFIASRSAGGIVRLWDAAGNLRSEIVCGAERLAWSPDSKYLLTGGGDFRNPDRPGELIVWDAITANQVHKLDGHRGFVLAIAWSADGSHLVSVDGNPLEVPPRPGELIVWNSSTFAKEVVWAPPTGCILDLAYSPDTKQVVASGFDSNVYFFDPMAKTILRTLKGHERSVGRIAYSHDGTRLVSGDASGVVRIWNVASGETERTLRASADAISGLCFNSKGDRLATACFDRTYRDSGLIGLWDVRSGQEILRISGQQTVEFSLDDRFLAVGSPGNVILPGSVRVFDATLPK